MLLINNVLLLVAAATILLGTLYPLALDAFDLGKISVGPPYFDAVFVPLMLPLLFLMGIGPLARWKQADPKELARRLWVHFALSVVVAVVALLATVGVAAILTFISITAAVWITVTTLDNLRVRIMAKNNFWTGLTTTPRAFYGVTVAHLGIAVFTVGVTLTSAYSVEKDVKLAPGESYELAGHMFRFEGVRHVTGPNYQAEEGRLTVLKNGRELTQLASQKRIYLVQRSPMTEAAIDPGLTRDLYVALGDPLGDGAWSVRLYHKPFVRWIWLGALIMALGGVLAATDPRYRLAARRRATEVTGATSRSQA
jgi:cytochrome c-type biogenesis protein CcmF